MENRNAELKVLWALQEMTAVDKMLEAGKI